LGPLLFSIFINDLCNAINHSRYLLFADDIKIFRAIRSRYDCSLLQSDIDSVQSWCTANFMKLNISKTRVISFSIKDLGVFTDSKLHFHNHVDYIFSQCIKLLGLVRAITFPFSSIGSLYMLYCTLSRSKLEYASVVWNSVTTTDANKVERIQQKFAALCYNRFHPKSITLIPTLLST
jgi:hypothetical protein